MDQDQLKNIEEKIIKYLAETGYITQIVDVWEALKNPKYRQMMLTGNGLMDEIGEISSEYCDCESLTNEEIQWVFDNDEK